MNWNKTIVKIKDCANQSRAIKRIHKLEGAIKAFRDFEAILCVEKDLGIYKPFHLGKIYFLVHF
jgi:hypothetical protein